MGFFPDPFEPSLEDGDELSFALFHPPLPFEPRPQFFQAPP